MTKPTIHLNGSNAEELFNGYQEAVEKLREALDAAAKTGPHGRDYYPQGESSIRAALADHRIRLATLEQVKGELEELASHCFQFIK